MSLRARDWREVGLTYFGFLLGFAAGFVAGWIVWEA